MVKPAVQIEGLRELLAELRKIGDDGLKQAMRDANLAIAKDIVEKALPHVPVRTGRLKRSVRALGNVTGALGKAGSAAVPYAAAIHWGRSAGNVAFRHGRQSKGQGAISGRPFLQDAAQSVERDVADRYADEVGRLFDAIRSR